MISEIEQALADRFPLAQTSGSIEARSGRLLSGGAEAVVFRWLKPAAPLKAVCAVRGDSGTGVFRWLKPAAPLKALARS